MYRIKVDHCVIHEDCDAVPGGLVNWDVGDVQVRVLVCCPFQIGAILKYQVDLISEFTQKRILQYCSCAHDIKSHIQHSLFWIFYFLRNKSIRCPLFAPRSYQLRRHLSSELSVSLAVICDGAIDMMCAALLPFVSASPFIG